MLGSTVALADSSGAVDTTYAYDPFGNVTVNGADTNPYQFTGRENDGTGLYYYRARYYSPTLQRFIAQDPIGFDGGDVDLYAVLLNSPVNFTDPAGLLLGVSPGVAGGLLGVLSVDPCPLGFALGIAGGIAGEMAGGAIGEEVGAGIGFGVGFVMDPLLAFPGAFIGGMAGLAVGQIAGTVTGISAGEMMGDALGDVLGMPGCTPGCDM